MNRNRQASKDGTVATSDSAPASSERCVVEPRAATFLVRGLVAKAETTGPSSDDCAHDERGK